MTGIPPIPHYAIMEEGKVDANFLLNRFNIIVFEYPKSSKYKDLCNWLHNFNQSVTSKRILPMTFGVSFATPKKKLDITSDTSDLIIVRGALPGLQPEECAGISCGRGYGPKPIPGYDGGKYLAANHIDQNDFKWVSDHVLARFRQGSKCSPYYGIVARSENPSAMDKQDLRIFPRCCDAFLTEAEKQEYRVARLMIVAGGPSSPYPPLHAAIQTIRGIRDWYRSHPLSKVRVVLHLVDPNIWFNISSGRLNLVELLQCDDFQIVTLIANPDGTTSRHYRIVSKTDTLISIADSLAVPIEGWAAELLPPPTHMWEHILLNDAAAQLPLLDLGTVPGSTLRFYAHSTRIDRPTLQGSGPD